MVGLLTDMPEVGTVVQFASRPNVARLNAATFLCSGLREVRRFTEPVTEIKLDTFAWTNLNSARNSIEGAVAAHQVHEGLNSNESNPNRSR